MNTKKLRQMKHTTNKQIIEKLKASQYYVAASMYKKLNK